MNIEERLKAMREKNLKLDNLKTKKIKPKILKIDKNIPSKLAKVDMTDKKTGFARGINKVDDNQIKAALMQFRGIIGRVCKKYNITRQSVWDRINKSPDLELALKHAREALKDDVEDGFLEAVQRKERWAIEKGMDRLLHDRGYVDKKQLETVDKRDEKDVERKKSALRNLSVDQLRAIRDTQLKAFEFSVSEN